MEDSKRRKNVLAVGTLLRGGAYDYEVRAVLGQGTFGITYLATVRLQGALGALDDGVKVAIKEFFMRDINGRRGTTVVTASDEGTCADYRRKFRREAVNLSTLHHPNIVKVLELFEANNTVYYVMEYAEGGSLDVYIAKRGGLEVEEALACVRQIGRALAFMHARGMLHLDLKPGNVMRGKDGRMILIDFGLSKQYNEQGEPESSTNVGGGTPGYAPLEQAAYHEGREFPVTMDVYALGATLYKMLTGERPAEASVVLNYGLDTGRMRACGVGEHVIMCVERAMAPMKAERYQSVREFVEELTGEVLEEEEETQADERTDEETTMDGKPKEVEGKGKKRGNGGSVRKRLWLWVAAVAVVVVMALLPWSRWLLLDPEAQLLHGEKYFRADPKNTVNRKAVKWYRKAAEQGNAEAQNRVAFCLFDGVGGIQDSVEAVKWWEKAAEQGHVEAQNRLAYCLFNGIGGIQDFAEATKWWQKAAEQGNANAQCELGNCYFGGLGVKKNYVEAVKWYRKAAGLGNAEAQCALGNCYYNRLGVRKDYVEAVKWYQEAAEQGNAEAQYALGDCYYFSWGVDRDHAEAEKRYQEAVKLYREAAERGNAEAQFHLGVCYNLGNGVEEDKVEGIKWFRKAAEQGHAEAQCRLGNCYCYGWGVSKDYTEALKWYRKAAEQGNAGAQCQLGQCYRFGYGVSKDYVEAVKWYRKAIEQNYSLALYNLSTCYYYGFGVEKNEVEAKKWGDRYNDLAFGVEALVE